MAIRQLKRRNASRRESRANWAMWQALYNKNLPVKRLERRDLQSGEITGSSRSKMNSETRWFNTFAPHKRLALPESLAWEELEKGAHLFTADAEFWIERDAPESGEFYQAGEIERIYRDVI